MTMKSLYLIPLIALLATMQAMAGEAQIRKSFAAHFPRAQVTSVSKTPLSGIYEVVVDGSQIVYTDANGQYVLLGELVDLKNRHSLTREHMDELLKVEFDKLPLQDAITMVKGKGSRRLAVFSDPDCPYCRKLQPELDKLDDVTIYIFPYPIASLHPDATRHSRLIWCSKDRVQAWEDVLLRGKVPAGGKTDCKNPVDANIALGRRLHIDGTPALIFSDGKRIPGYTDARHIEQMLRLAESGGKR
jgi:thiol:disulfide interchange protein DsbC